MSSKNRKSGIKVRRFVSFFCLLLLCGLFLCAFDGNRVANKKVKAKVPAKGKSPEHLCNQIQGTENNDTLFQSSTVFALYQKLFDGNMTIDQLKKHGDMGVGTFHAFDGELIGIDGEFYKVKASDGLAYLVPGNEKTPFSLVAIFKPDSIEQLEGVGNFIELQQLVMKKLPSQDMFYAFRGEGTFSYVKTRSVFAQKKPYPDLRQIMGDQVFFELKNVEGYLVGFWCPKYIQGVGSPGFHLHFITKDKKKGGHLIECQIEKLELGIHYLNTFKMVLPYQIPEKDSQ